MTELIFNIKCSCLDVQILKEKLNSGGVIILGLTTRGGRHKLNPCSWGGEGSRKWYILMLKNYQLTPLLKNERFLTRLTIFQNWDCAV